MEEKKKWFFHILFKIMAIFSPYSELTSHPVFTIVKYSARLLIGSRIIESAAYCNQILLAHLYHNRTQSSSVNWIIRFLLSLLRWPKVILLSGGHCNSFLIFKLTFKTMRDEKKWMNESFCKPKKVENVATHFFHLLWIKKSWSSEFLHEL